MIVAAIAAQPLAPIQPILIALVVTIGGLYFMTHRSRFVFQLAVLVLMGAGVAFILQPELTNRIARLVGVGRGADLLLYILYLATAGAFLQNYRKSRTIEEKLTEIVRQTAIANARPPALTEGDDSLA